jgi:transposase
MSDDEQALHERFILTVRTPNGRKPTTRCLVLDGIFWIALTGLPWATLLKSLESDHPSTANTDTGRAPGRGNRSWIRLFKTGRFATPLRCRAGHPHSENPQAAGGSGRTLYRLRNLVEQCVNELKNARRVVTRHNKTADRFWGVIEITSIRLCLRHLST